jgi:hypothetical protein
MKETHQRAGISREDFILAATKAIACLVTYRITTHGLSHCLNHADDLLGGIQKNTLGESCSGCFAFDCDECKFFALSGLTFDSAV